MASKKSKRRRYLRSPEFSRKLETSVRLIKNFVRDKTGAKSPESFTPNQLFDTACAAAGIPRPRSLGGENSAEYAIRLVPFLGLTKTDNRPKVKHQAAPQLSKREQEIRDFYRSKEWRTSKARYTALREAKGRCKCCGRSKDEDGVKLVVDHIKPVRKFWSLRFETNNLQVLCNDCNLGKGSWDQTDWRYPVEIVNATLLDDELVMSHWRSI